MLINLLPQEQLEKIKVMKLSRRATGLIFLIVFLNVIIISYLLYLNFKFQEELSLSQKRVFTKDVEGKVRDLANFEKKVKDTRSFLEKAKGINAQEKNQLLWSDILKELATFWEEGITFQRFEVSSDNFKEITLTGLASSRDKVLNLERKLRESKYYKEVISPISNLTSKDNISFEFTLNLKDGSEN